MAHRLSRRSFVQLPALGLVTLAPPVFAGARGRAAAGRRLVPPAGSRARPGSGGRLARQPGQGARAGRAPAGAGRARPSTGASATGRRRWAPRRTPAGARSPSCCWPMAPSRRCSRRRCSASSTSSARSSRRVPASRASSARTASRCWPTPAPAAPTPPPWSVPRGRRRRRRANHDRSRWHRPTAMRSSAGTASAPARATTSTSTCERDQLGIDRPEATRRNLLHTGEPGVLPGRGPEREDRLRPRGREGHAADRRRPASAGDGDADLAARG